LQLSYRSPVLPDGGATAGCGVPPCHVGADQVEELIDGDPKSRAGTRTVAFPADIVPELADHLEQFANPKPNGLVFIGPKGGRLGSSVAGLVG
jgi:hypothetical protein